MGVQDEAGSAVALPPPLLPPPPLVVVLLDFLLPPHPAATSARITAIAATAPSVSRLLTLPPRSRTIVSRAGFRPIVGASIRPDSGTLQPQSAWTTAKSWKCCPPVTSSRLGWASAVRKGSAGESGLHAARGLLAGGLDAEGGNRTHTARRPPAFESVASPTSATSAGFLPARSPGRLLPPA